MAQSFDIRFARSEGFAALLEAPTNSFRFTGAGRLSVDANGISVAMKRGLMTLLARDRTRRILAADLKEVFREGEALRVEFATDEAARASLLFWAEDRDTAAQIVRLLPTSRTVELEHNTNPLDKKFRSSAHLIGWFFAAIVCVVVSATAWWNYRSPAVAPPSFDLPQVHVPLLPDVELAPAPVPVSAPRNGVESFIVEIPMPPLRMPQLPALDVVPIAKGTPAYQIARRQLRTFESEAATLWADYRVERDQLAARSLAPDKFAAHLGELEMRWWNVTFRILDDRELDAAELLDLRADLLGTARNWRAFLEGYANGIRNGDHLMIATSFDRLAIAEEQQARARQYVR